MNGGVLKDLFAQSDRKNYARKLVIPHIEREVAKRKKITNKDFEAIPNVLKNLLEEIAEEKNENLDKLENLIVKRQLLNILTQRIELLTSV